jgi:hypothetical protein
LIHSCIAESGGAIHAASGTHSISDSRFFENYAIGDGGGGVAISSGGITLERAVIVRNGGYLGAGGVHVANSSAALFRCTITDNGSSSSLAAGIVALNATVDLRESILRFSCNGSRDLASTAGSTVQVECCNIDPAMAVEQSGSIAWGAGIVTAAPSFCHPVLCQEQWLQGDFRVTNDSPCLPENNSCGLLIGAFTSGCSVTSIESRSWGSIKAMYRSSE